MAGQKDNEVMRILANSYVEHEKNRVALEKEEKHERKKRLRLARNEKKKLQ